MSEKLTEQEILNRLKANEAVIKGFGESLFDRPVDLVLADAIKPRLRSPILENVVHVAGTMRSISKTFS